MVFPMVLVAWEDAFSVGSDWSKVDELNTEFSSTLTCGFLVEKNKKMVVVALSLDAGGRVADAIVIPRRNVVSIKRLK